MSYKETRTNNRYSYRLAFYGPVPLRKSWKALRLALKILWKALNGKYFMIEGYNPEADYLAQLEKDRRVQAVLWQDK